MSINVTTLHAALTHYVNTTFLTVINKREFIMRTAKTWMRVTFMQAGINYFLMFATETSFKMRAFKVMLHCTLKHRQEILKPHNTAHRREWLEICASLRCTFFSLGNSGLCWTVFARNMDTVVPAGGNGNLQTLICVLVARPRQCLTLWNPFPWQNWMAAYLGYTLRMRTLFRGWPIMVNDTHTRRRRLRWNALSHSCCPCITA